MDLSSQRVWPICRCLFPNYGRHIYFLVHGQERFEMAPKQITGKWARGSVSIRRVMDATRMDRHVEDIALYDIRVLHLFLPR